MPTELPNHSRTEARQTLQFFKVYIRLLAARATVQVDRAISRIESLFRTKP